MKIIAKPRKVISPPPQVADLINKLHATPNDELVETLRQVDTWKWPRSDLNAWIKVLNKFDDILDEIIVEYAIEKLQKKPFTEASKSMLSEILRFERLLLENSTNRKTFSSYDRLNSLLSTSDLDVLILALNLLLRPSQQYSSQPSVAHALSISTTRLQSLSKRWPSVAEHGFGLVDLVSTKPAKNVRDLPSEAREVSFTFYKADLPASEDEKKAEADTEVPPSSPLKPTATTHSNSVHVRVDEQTLASQPVMKVLEDVVQTHSVPDNETFELLCRIRAASVLQEGQSSDREKLIIIRLLAIAIYGHTHNESQALSALFLYEPDLVLHIAELLQVDQGVPISVQTAAISALDALARYKSKIPEVLIAVNAGVNHGILMALMRNMVSEVSNPESRLPHSFIEALISFITYLASHASGGNMVVGAGLIPLLIQIIENRTPSRLPVISKTMQLVDNVLYSFTNAFSLFCASRGVEVLVGRIEHEIDFDIETYGVVQQPCAIVGQGELPISRIAVLKHIMRSMHRMMQSSGTAEGLRGLIDMSLLKSVKKVMAWRGLFGPNIFPLAINVMSTFIHNEPTSLAVIQEAGLPEIFYKTIEVGIEPAIEVIQSIPNAIGALCLNEVGQAQLAKRPSIIPAVFSIFISDKHLKILLDKENAVIVGTAVDELIRHHPALKGAVFSSLKSTLAMIEELGNSFAIPNNIKHWYLLSPAGAPVPPPQDTDVIMADEAPVVSEVPATEVGATTPGVVPEEDKEENEEEEYHHQDHENVVSGYIDALGRFLEGFFQHSPHCRDFVTSTDGLKAFGRLTGLPCLPYDFANSVASDSMVQVLRTMAEVLPNDSLVYMTELVKESLEETNFFWKDITEPSKLLPFVELPGDDSGFANRQFRSLVTLHIRITLLSDVVATAGQTQGRATMGILQTLITSTPLDVLQNLGTLHRASVWENIALNTGLLSKGIESRDGSLTPPIQDLALPAPMDLTDGDAPVLANGLADANGTQPASSTAAPVSGSASNPPKAEGPRDWNAAALKHITQGLPHSLAPFFHSIVKMFHARRNPDPAQRKHVVQGSKIIARIMLDHLTPLDFDDKPSLYNYYGVILSLFTMLLVDDRNPTHTVHTIPLFAFYRLGGFDAVFETCKIFIDKIEDVEKIKEDERSEVAKKELLHAYGALKIALYLINPIVSSKPLFESGQTVLMATRDKKDTDPDYFEPHDFLVKLRLAALPMIEGLWRAPWLVQAPLSVSKYVVRSVLEIANGENEESATPTTTDGPPDIPSIPPMPPGPDEATIEALTDMGFPRSAVERALARAGNNITTATEILLSQPFPLPPDPVPAEPAEPTAEPSQPTSPSTETPPTDQPAAEENETPADAAAPEAPPGKSPAEWRAALNDARAALKESISRQSLTLIDEHRSLLFDLHIAFTKKSPHQAQAVRDLVEDVKSFSPFAYDVQEQPLANRCRLLALVLCETPSALDDDLRNQLMENLRALLLSSIDPEHPPRWLAAHLLVMEALFTLSDEPRSIVLPKEGEPIVPERIAVGPSRADARSVVFDFCLRLLAVEDLATDELLSVLRLFVLFTRDRDMAAQFIARDGLVSLFKRVKHSPISGGSSYIATILRHLVEDAATIQSIMQQTIKRYFTQSRARSTDASTYVRNCSAIALRDVDIFIDTTKSLCKLTLPYAPSPQISLQSDPTTEKAEGKDKSAAPTEGTTDMQVDSPTLSTSNPAYKASEALIHLLVSELMLAVKASNEEQSAPAPATTPVTATATTEAQTATTSVAGTPPSTAAATSVAPVEAPAVPADLHDKYHHVYFLMQCLTELLFSYDSCKVAFLSYSTKKRSQQTPSKDAGKFRYTTLQFLLNDLMTYGTINGSSDPKHRHRNFNCNWAMNVVGALCVDTSSSHEAKEVSQELTTVRKFVLDTISRTIKDLGSIENYESRYAKLFALADLCHRLLTVRVNATPTRKQDEVPTHIAKIMLEKNFVAILTSALSEVDLNYPNVRNVVSAILRPLEYLSKIAIKMSKTSKSKEDDKQDSESVESEEEDEEMEANREETPDLYRNSALGMYGGEMDDGQYQDEDQMDEDDEDEDVEMEYGDETGSEDTSGTDDDEEEEDDLEHVGTDSEGVWDEAEGGEEEDLVEDANEEDEEDEDEDEDDVDEEEVDEGDEEEDEGMVWEDVEDEDGLGLSIDNVVEDGHGVPIHITREDDEPEGASDEEGLIMDPMAFPPEGLFALGDGTMQFGGLFVHRRHRNTDLQPFGRSRGVPSAPEAITHPLLLDMTTAAHRAQSHQGRPFRQGHRLLGQHDMDGLLTFDQVFGHQSHQVLEQIISQNGLAGDTFHIQVPAGALFQHGRRFGGQSSRNDRNIRTHSHKQGRDFDPLLTLQRWAEEMKILHGDFLAPRIGRLSNHVILALLPAAVEAQKEAKAKEEEARIKAEEERRKAEEEEQRKKEEEEEKEKEIVKEAEAEAPGPSTKEPEQEQPAERQLTPTPIVQDEAEAPHDAPVPDSDAVMAEPTPDTEMPDEGSAVPTDGVPPPPETPDPASAAPGPSEPAPRVTVMIHGSPVDITDTGIDPTFLEALPDDMREEVLNQHVRDQQAARVERPSDSAISAEFLDALPPEIRAEIIQQEAIERERRNREPPPTQREPAEMDPASFIASLDPSLRQAVLLDQDDGFIQTLPSHMIAEAGAYRDELSRRNIPSRIINRAVPPPAAPRKYVPPHDAILLLDRPGIAVLIRLLFFPQVLKKALLFKVLQNLCENSKTRTELFNILLSILQDGTGDLAAIDKSFAQMSVRTKEPKTPSKSSGKQKAGEQSPPYASQLETVPDLVAQRCLEALMSIVSTSETSSIFFLTEHELPSALRRQASKKGKGKEKQVPQGHYPLVLLLNLLDRQNLLRTPSILESVVTLLATVTRPLTSLKEKKEEAEKLPPASEPLSGTNTQSLPSSTTDQTTPAPIHPTTSTPPQPNEPSQAPTSTQPPSNDDAASTKPKDTESPVPEKDLLPHPPQVPQHALRLIVNILTVGECSGRTFQQSLALIQHLSHIPEARDVIAFELKAKAQEFGQTLIDDLDELAVALQKSQDNVMLTSIAAKFSSASSTQAKLLRVLKTIDYMYTPKTPTPEGNNSEDVEKVQAIYESFRFTPLWRRLGDCLTIIGAKPETEHIATVLLPLIEALMVVCKFVGSKHAPVSRAIRATMSPKSPTTPRESMEDLFVTFTDNHRKILNLMVRNNPSLMSGSFSLLVNNPRVLDFDNKRNYFNQQLHRKPHAREHYGTLQLSVRRSRVFEDSFLYLLRKTGDQIKYGKLSVRFYDEEGVDAGGLTREWFQILARQMFNPDYALFQPCAADKLTYQPNKNSGINPEHLAFFKFVGRVIGKAIYDGRLLDAYFARSLYRQLLGKPVDYKDVEWVDPEYYKSLCWILENDPTMLDLTFIVEADEFGVNRVIPLKEGGDQILVTQENRREYVQLSAQYRLYSSIKDQIENLRSGFYEIIPKDLVTIFNEQELELLISGTPDIDVDEWRSTTEYNGYTSSDPNIVWFWRALKSFNREERAKVLSFATGTSRVPLSGFADLQGVQGVQRFSIHRAYGQPDRLPQAHTCFNQIDLPQYSSYEMLRQQLLVAINEGGEGFAFS